MIIRKTRSRVVVITTVAALIGFYVMFPVYPAFQSVCELIEARSHVSDRWATPYRGATLLLRGTIIGGPQGALGFMTVCKGEPVLFAVETTPVTLTTPLTNRTLRRIANSNWQREDRSVSAVILARVSSEVQSCFGPGLVITALAVRTTEPVVVTPTNRDKVNGRAQLCRSSGRLSYNELCQPVSGRDSEILLGEASGAAERHQR
ncbi:MAG TPA: hypothetical protein VN493_06465 [Thermoanaerobaculia bacterium]|nr:hypothetical protein [Thermoanaerobaculia bacterium]